MLVSEPASSFGASGVAGALVSTMKSRNEKKELPADVPTCTASA
jgi:hypothetical protein